MRLWCEGRDDPVRFSSGEFPIFGGADGDIRGGPVRARPCGAYGPYALASRWALLAPARPLRPAGLAGPRTPCSFQLSGYSDEVHRLGPSTVRRAPMFDAGLLLEQAWIREHCPGAAAAFMELPAVTAAHC